MKVLLLAILGLVVVGAYSAKAGNCTTTCQTVYGTTTCNQHCY